MQVTILNNQSLFDVSVRYFGTTDAAHEIAFLNGINITNVLKAGQILKLPLKDFGNSEIVAFFRNNKIDPATAFFTTADNSLEYQFAYELPMTL